MSGGKQQWKDSLAQVANTILKNVDLRRYSSLLPEAKLRAKIKGAPNRLQITLDAIAEDSRKEERIAALFDAFYGIGLPPSLLMEVMSETISNGAIEAQNDFITRTALLPYLGTVQLAITLYDGIYDFYNANIKLLSDEQQQSLVEWQTDILNSEKRGKVFAVGNLPALKRKALYEYLSELIQVELFRNNPAADEMIEFFDQQEREIDLVHEATVERRRQEPKSNDNMLRRISAMIRPRPTSVAFTMITPADGVVAAPAPVISAAVPSKPKTQELDKIDVLTPILIGIAKETPVQDITASDIQNFLDLQKECGTDATNLYHISSILEALLVISDPRYYDAHNTTHPIDDAEIVSENDHIAIYKNNRIDGKKYGIKYNGNIIASRKVDEHGRMLKHYNVANALVDQIRVHYGIVSVQNKLGEPLDVISVKIFVKALQLFERAEKHRLTVYEKLLEKISINDACFAAKKEFIKAVVDNQKNIFANADYGIEKLLSYVDLTTVTLKPNSANAFVDAWGKFITALKPINDILGRPTILYEQDPWTLVKTIVQKLNNRQTFDINYVPFLNNLFFGLQQLLSSKLDQSSITDLTLATKILGLQEQLITMHEFKVSHPFFKAFAEFAVEADPIFAKVAAAPSPGITVPSPVIQ